MGGTESDLTPASTLIFSKFLVRSTSLTVALGRSPSPDSTPSSATGNSEVAAPISSDTPEAEQVRSLPTVRPLLNPDFSITMGSTLCPHTESG
ncbi:hypothetical protein M758_UG205800 [Ceratodon purpureus]|nr:hypothetical protein M758_UG205800 [Ceratodon purpureus]